MTPEDPRWPWTTWIAVGTHNQIDRWHARYGYLLDGRPLIRVAHPKDGEGLRGLRFGSDRERVAVIVLPHRDDDPLHEALRDAVVARTGDRAAYLCARTVCVDCGGPRWRDLTRRASPDGQPRCTTCTSALDLTATRRKMGA